MSSFVKKEIEIAEFRSVYYFEHGKEFYHAPEQHNFWEIVYVDKGEIIAVTDGIGRTLTEGEVIFHEPNDVHAHISNKLVSNNMFVVSFVTESPSMDFFRKKIFRLDENSKKMLSMFMTEAKNALGEIQGDYYHRYKPDFDNEKFGSTQLMAAYLEEFLIKLIRQGGDSGDLMISTEESRRVANNSTAALNEDYLKTKIYDDISLSEVCGHFYLGKSKLTEIFKTHTGKSPMQYLNDLKVAEAKALLRNGEHSVGEISEMLCFSGIQSFTRSFKNATGFSPTAYTKSIY